MPPPVRLADLTIANGQTASEAMSFVDGLRYAIEYIAIYTPDSFGTAGTVTVRARRTGGDWKDLMSGGAAVQLTTDDCVIIDRIPFQELRIESASDPGTDLVFELSGREEK